MKTLHVCEFEIVDDKPIYAYYDYSGFHVGVFRCKCKKCGREMGRKYPPVKKLRELFF